MLDTAYRIKSWKILSAALILLLFISLYGFIYHQSIQLPSDNWSNPIVLDEYNSRLNHETLKTKNTIALAIDAKSFVNIFIRDKSAVFKTFNTSGELVNENTMHFDFNLTEIGGYIVNGKYNLILYSREADEVKFINLMAKDLELIDEKSYDLKGKKIKMSDTHITAYDDKQITIYDFNNTMTINTNVDGTIKHIDSIQIDGKYMTIATFKENGTHKLGEISTGGAPINKYMYRLSAINTISPTNVEINENMGNLEVLVTMVNAKTKGSYIEKFDLNEKSQIEQNNIYSLNTHEAIPYIIKTKEQNSYIFNIRKSTLGRTEMSRGFKEYPNLYLISTLGSENYKQLTNSEIMSRKPSYLRVGEYNYLIFNEQTNDSNRVYLSSDNPEIIEKSRQWSFKMALDVFIRTILNYPALLFTSLFATIDILLPVVFIVGPLLLFRIKWFENDTRKVSLIIFVTYTLSKIYVYAHSIFGNITNSQMLPDYLRPGLSHWGVFIVISLLTILISWDRLKSFSRKNYLKHIMIYILIDSVALSLFFIPYKII